MKCVRHCLHNCESHTFHVLHSCTTLCLSITESVCLRWQQSIAVLHCKYCTAYNQHLYCTTLHISSLCTALLCASASLDCFIVLVPQYCITMLCTAQNMYICTLHYCPTALLCASASPGLFACGDTVQIAP